MVQNGLGQVIDTLINVGNHNLHFNIIKGKNTPILFESGNGSDGSVWKDLLEQLSASTGATLITYDRAGLGKSEIDSLNIGFENEVKNLEIALEKLGYSDKIFIVSHSFGGFYSSLFSFRNKDKVIGAVFIDVATPCDMNTERATRIKNFISEENWQMIKKYKLGLYYVLKKLPTISNYMEERYIPSSIPLTLIVAESHNPTPQIGDTENDMINWEKCLKEFGNLPNHKYILAKETEHRVWEKNPQIVIDEIIDLYSKEAKKEK